MKKKLLLILGSMSLGLSVGANPILFPEGDVNRQLEIQGEYECFGKKPVKSF